MGIIQSHVKHLNIPLGFGFPFGHESPNLAVPIGLEAKLKVNKDGSDLRLEY